MKLHFLKGTHTSWTLCLSMLLISVLMSVCMFYLETGGETKAECQLCHQMERNSFSEDIKSPLDEKIQQSGAEMINWDESIIQIIFN